MMAGADMKQHSTSLDLSPPKDHNRPAHNDQWKVDHHRRGQSKAQQLADAQTHLLPCNLSISPTKAIELL